MAALTYGELRHLVRLRRDGIAGAEERLAEIIATRIEDLPGLVGFAPEHLDRLREADDPVELLAGTVEAAPRVLKVRRVEAERAVARGLAQQLAATAQYDGDRVVLDVSMLAATVSTWPGNGSIVFGARSCSDVGTVRALLQACRRATAISAVIAGTRLVVMYETASSRGHVALNLDGHIEHQDVLVVPLHEHPQCVLSQEQSHTALSPSDDDALQPPQGLRHAIRSPRRPSRPFTGFLGHLVAAAVEALAAR